MDPDWIVPDWPVPTHVRALCSTRAGGVSKGPYASLNLGTHVGDDPEAVAFNRTRLQAALGSARPIFLEQVHGIEMVVLTQHTPEGVCADACMTWVAGVASTVMVADCLPVLFTDAQGTRVAAAHAGWRGLVAGVLQHTWKAFDGAEVVAWLGPCIGPRAFEVGSEVRAAFLAGDAQAHLHFLPAATPGKWLADLPGLARRQLCALGVAVHGNDGSDAWCTVSNPSRFFSYRRDGITGRLAALIWLADA